VCRLRLTPGRNSGHALALPLGPHSGAVSSSAANRPLWRAAAASAVILLLAFAVFLRMGAPSATKTASAPASEVKSAQAPEASRAMPVPVPSATPLAAPQAGPTVARDSVGPVSGAGPAGAASPYFGTLFNMTVEPEQGAYLPDRTST